MPRLGLSYLIIAFVGIGSFIAAMGFLTADQAWALNINQYRDTITNSAPLQPSNHTLSFVVKTDVSPGGYLELTPPAGFVTLATSSFAAERNVTMSVNGSLRAVSGTLSTSSDQVEIVPGSPGLIRYTLNTETGLEADDQVEIRIGNHTPLALVPIETYSTSTGTTTIPGDIKPIVNASTTGTHQFDLQIFDGTKIAYAGFLISLVDQVGVGPIDTTEEIPPYRFNGAPTGQLSGTTINVELSLETDEFALCKFGTVPGVEYEDMSNFFDNTGLVFHSEVVAVTPDSTNTFYVRCIDDELNFNTDDYVITFTVNPVPTGSVNTEGDVDGDGTGTGNGGAGEGSGSGGDDGSASGDGPDDEGSDSSGGSGGGGGGGSGGNRGGSGGGGFESKDGPYRSGDGRVVITGYAPSRSKVTALVDGKITETATAGGNGAFEVVVDMIARGAYTFGVYATDSAGGRSSTFSTSFTVSGARTSSLSNIYISPTIKVAPDPVTAGSPLTISGFAIPDAAVSIENEKDGSSASRKSFSATAGSNGAWTVAVDTGGFTNGTYKARAKATTPGGVATNYSAYVVYGVGQSATRSLNSDLNSDGRINLTDFSILLFWWNTAGSDVEPSSDINADGRVNLTDFSILLFNWTG